MTHTRNASERVFNSIRSLHAHARSTSTCTPDVTLLRPRTPNNDSLTVEVDQTEWRSHEAAVTPKLIEPLVWQVPKEWQVQQEPLLEVKDHVIAPPRLRRHYIALGMLWVLSLVLTSAVTFWITKLSQPVRNALGTFDRGFVTDMSIARSAIQVHTQQFYGTLDFKARHGFFPPGTPSEKYIGAGEAVDTAWDDLTRDRYFLLSDEEAYETYGEDPSPYWNVHHGGYIAGLDVLHTLHCLNHIRMGLYPTVYPQDPEHAVIHRAHCVEHLRQLAMCHGDLTVVPTQWFDGLSRNYINSSQVHTCRDFSQIRAWTNERINGSKAVPPRNRDGSPREEVLVPWSP